MNRTGAARLPRRVTRAMSTVAMAALMAGCSATASGTPTASPTALPTAMTSPTAATTPSTSAVLSPAPTATPAASSAPSIPPASWTTPQPAGPALMCATYAESSVSLVIDTAGGDHAAYTCDGLIRVAESSDGGHTWSTTSVPPPAGERDLAPLLAIDGSVLYMAYERVAPAEGCGSTGATDLGVRYRTRTLDGAVWSAPRAIGDTGDELDALRVVGGTLHVAVHADAAMAYETLHGTTYHRYSIAVHTGGAAASLRLGDDGKARVVWEDSDLPGDDSLIEYGLFTGSGFSTAAIPGSDEGWAPQLVLGATDAAYVVWNRSAQPGGCVIRGAEPTDGTYFATNVSGVWVSSRLTPTVGDAALTVDVVTGRIHALVSGVDPNVCCPQEPGDLLYLTQMAGGPWAQTALMPVEVASPVIKLDPATGGLLVMFERSAPDGTTRIYAMARP